MKKIFNIRWLFFYFMKLTLFTGVLLLIFPYILNLINNNDGIIIKDTNYLKVGHWILFMAYLLFAGFRYKGNYKIDGHWVVSYSPFLIIFILFFIIRDDYIALPGNCFYKYYYSLFIIILIEIWLSKFPKAVKGEHESFLLLDTPWQKGDKDIFEFQDKAKALAKEIKTIYSKDEAICIALTGRWGVGKTSFINMLDVEFENEPDILTKKFSPWKSVGQHKITESFFQSIKESLSPYSPELNSKLKKYSNALSSFDSSGLINAFSNFIDNDKSYETYLEEINQVLNRVNKKLVVYIDDVDRLEYEEIMDIIKLMRNTANLHNTVFICAFDRNYVFKAFREKKIDNPSEFFEKIFQFELNLNPSNKNLSVHTLFDLLYERFGSKKELFKFTISKRNVISAITPIDKEAFFDLPKSIINNLLIIRNVKRVYNSFSYAMSIVGNITWVDKLLVLEMLRVNNQDFYYLIRSLGESNLGFGRLFVKVDTVDNHELIIEQALATNIIEVKDKDDYLKILGFLGTKSKKDNSRNFLIYNFQIYYDYINPKMTSQLVLDIVVKNKDRIIARLEELKTEDSEEFTKALNMVRQGFFVNYIESDIVEWKKEAKDYFEMITYILKNSEDQVYLDYINVLDKIEWEKLLDGSNVTKVEITQMLTDFIDDNLNYSAYLFQSYIRNAIYHEDKKYFFNKQESQVIALKNLQFNIASKKATYLDNEVALFCCYEDIADETNRVTLMHDACEVFKDYIIENSNGFINYLIRPRMFVGIDSYEAAFFPVVLQVFKKIEIFEHFINDLPDNGKWNKLAKKYLPKFKLSVEKKKRDYAFLLDKEDIELFFDENHQPKRSFEIYRE